MVLRLILGAGEIDRPGITYRRCSAVPGCGWRSSPPRPGRCGERRLHARRSRNHRAERIASTLRHEDAAAISSPASVGLRPTSTPAAARASIFPCAVPLPPDTMAPAWPILRPAGAVTPAM